MDRKSARQFLDLLNYRGDIAKIERVQHPEKRLHMIYRASHPGVGVSEAETEAKAWTKLCDRAEKKGPATQVDASIQVDNGLCRAKTKKGRPCQNVPQKGEEYCGPHLTKLQSGY